MQFTSLEFFIFLGVVLFLYYVIPQKYRNYLILFASYYFYFSLKAEYIVILIASTLLNYSLGRLIEKDIVHKKFYLSLSLIFNIGILFFFKYLNFFSGQLNLLFSKLSLNINLPKHSLILPIGISYYTLMAIGYILDVYWGDIPAQKNYIIFSNYLAFFPQIMSGPIGRAKSLFKQFNEKHPFLYFNMSNGLRLILWGLFKKMVIADPIGDYVNAVYNNIPMHSSLTLIFTTLLYPLQLYTDFSGYTDIARGVAKLLGFNLMVNFRAPYVHSTSVTEFWHRYHISLTSWLREYIFYPCMGTHTEKKRIYEGILLIFLISGFWHGASWMFIIWGLFQAFYLISEDVLKINAKKFIKFPQKQLHKIMTYLLLSFSFLFFRLPDIDSFNLFLKTLFGQPGSFYIGNLGSLCTFILGLMILISIELLLNKKQFDEWIGDKKPGFRYAIYLSISLIIILFGSINGSSFIYFQF